MRFPRKKTTKASANPLDDLARARARLAAINPEVLVALATDEHKRKQLQEMRARMAETLAEHEKAVAELTDIAERLDRALQSAVEA